MDNKDGDTYNGRFKDDHPKGVGTATWKIGNRYKGQFVDGEPDSKRIFFYASGKRWEGYFKGGNFVRLTCCAVICTLFFSLYDMIPHYWKLRLDSRMPQPSSIRDPTELQ